MPRLRRRVLCAWTGLHVVIFVLALRAIVDRRFFGRLAPLVGKQPMTLPSGPSPIHLVLTCSATYAIGLLAVVNSTVQSASPATRARLRIHLVTTEGSEEAEILRQLDAQLGDVLKEHAITLLPHVAGPILKRQLAQAKPIVYARYFLPDILPPSIEKAIYLDQDVVVKKDLAPLWDAVDLEGHPIAAARLCRDGALWARQLKMDDPLIKAAGYDSDTCTLNNGVLVYNLTAWRTADPSYTSQLVHWTQQNSQRRIYTLGSQPPFNLVVLDQDWNLLDLAGLREVTTHGWALPATRSRADVDRAAILHWNGMFKPWMCDGEGYYSELWVQHLPGFRDHVHPDLFTPELSADTQCQELVVTQHSRPPSTERFTVVLSIHQRQALPKLLKMMSRSDYVKEVLVVWHQPGLCSPEVGALPSVRCLQNSGIGSPADKFAAWRHISTEGVLLHDDRYHAPLQDLEAAFHVWATHRSQVLGFEPRLAGSLFFLSKDHMRFLAQHRGLLSVLERGQCEDLVLSFLTAIESGSPASSSPVLFKGNVARRRGHVLFPDPRTLQEEQDCLERLLDISRGRLPEPQFSFYEVDEVRDGRVYKLPVERYLTKGWCIEREGPRACKEE